MTVSPIRDGVTGVENLNPFYYAAQYILMVKNCGM